MYTEPFYRVAKSITTWKNNTKFENFLAIKADKSETWKKLYVLYYKIQNPSYYKKGLELIKKEIQKQRPNIYSLRFLSDKFLVKDIIYSLHRFGTAPQDYFGFKFYALNYIGRETFNNIKLQYGYCEIYNTQEARELCENKFKAYSLLQPYYKRELFFYNMKEKKNELEVFLSRHKKIIVKPFDGNSGKKIRIYDTCRFDLSILENYLENGGAVIEELIVQADELSVLNPSTVNTVRIATFRSKDNIEIISSALRMGRLGAFVDNAGSGGIFALLDSEYGIINTRPKDLNCNYYLFHPDTNIPLLGFRIPQWKDAIDLVKEVSKLIPGGNILAWDLALTKKGWCIVEVNDVGDPYLIQSIDINSIKPKLFKIFKKYQ